MDEVYRDSGFRQFRESLFADETNDLEVDQAVTAFDTPTAAKHSSPARWIPGASAPART